MTPEYRTDMDVLLGVPEQLFIEFSEKYGDAGTDQKKFEGSLVRPLPKLGLYGEGQSYETVAGALAYSAHRFGDGSQGARVELLHRMPLEGDEMSTTRGVYIEPTLKIFVSRVKMPHSFPGEREFSLHAAMDYPFNEGFSLISSIRLWLIVREMQDRFVELASGFPFSVREKDGVMEDHPD